MYVSDTNDPPVAHHRPEPLHHRHERIRARADRAEIAVAAHLEQRLLHFGSVRERMHDDVERLGAEIRDKPFGKPVDRAVADVLVALVRPDVFRESSSSAS